LATDKQTDEQTDGQHQRVKALSLSQRDLIKVEVSVFIQRLYCSTSHCRRSGTDHTVLPANYTDLPLPRKRSSDGASPENGTNQSYTSMID